MHNVYLDELIILVVIVGFHHKPTVAHSNWSGVHLIVSYFQTAVFNM